MAQAVLNQAINNLEENTTLYNLYTRLYDGMSAANRTDAPDYVANPPYEHNPDGTYKVDQDGAKIVDKQAIKDGLESYSEILIKNSAYMFANAIISTVLPGGSTGTGSEGGLYVARSGDTMAGLFGALHGFEAGYNNKKILETTINSDDEQAVYVYGKLYVDGNTSIGGQLHLSDSGIYFGENQVIFYDQSSLCLSSQNINISGSVDLDGVIKIGKLSISKTGIYIDGYEYYHNGNANLPSIDWTMKNANVYGDLHVHNNTQLDGLLHAKQGFVFEEFGNRLLYSVKDADSLEAHIELNSDLSLTNNHGIKLNNNYIVWIRDSGNIVSFAAPNSIMNLGDKGVGKDGVEAQTKYIALQTNIKNYNGAYDIITHDGTGNFPNGFSVGAANALAPTFQTYHTSHTDYGVVAKDKFRYGSTSGPAISGLNNSLLYELPYSTIVGSLPYNGVSNMNVKPVRSSSLIFNPTNNEMFMAIQFTTDAKHFLFDTPIETSRLVIKSDRYKTRLEEDVLFFDDGKFIEGINGGMRWSQNAMFDGNLFSYNPSSQGISFSSGFAGSGWAIMEDVKAGGIHATFDSLTIRKKMRVYELEVQKVSVTNGSLWVSDSCSGDEVRELS